MSLAGRMRIAYINHTGNVSGAECVLLDILKGLDRNQYDPILLCPDEGRLRSDVIALNVDCAPLPEVRARFTMRPADLTLAVSSMWKAVFTLRKELVKLKPDLVHANTIRSGIIAAIATTGSSIPIVWHVHDILPRHPLSMAIRLFARLSKRTHLVAVSHATAKAFCGAFDLGARARTIHNGVDLERFPQKTANASLFKESIGIPHDVFLISAIGQICERKGLRELIEAFQQICKSVPNAHLAIVGRVVFAHEEGYLKLLQEVARASECADRIHFTGELSNVSQVFQGSDLVVLNSKQEPFGLVLVEAMSSGTPVLATRVGGIPEIVTDEVNGWLIEKDDPVGLSSRLLSLATCDQALLKQVAQTAHGSTCPQFSLQRFHSNLIRLYSEFDSTRPMSLNLTNAPTYSVNGRS